MEERKLPLEGLKVIELGTHFAVPSVTRMLADWGAEVVKVESIAGDAWRIVGRNQKCPITDEENPFFMVPNANKKFVALNLKEEQGKEALIKLIGTAEIFISNMRMPALTKLGFDYQQLSKRYPELIYVHFTGYGYKGPDAAKPGFDSVAFWARSGAMLDWGTKGNFPFLAPTGAGDAMTGSILCAGVLAALIGKRETGKGTFVSSSLMGSSIWYNNAAVVSTQYGNQFPKDKDHPANPFGWQYECADGEWLMIGVVDYADAYRKIFHLFGRDDMLEDERFNTITAVQQHMDEFMPVLRGYFKTKPRDEWVKLIGELNIVIGKIGHISELAEDEQAVANGFVRPVTFPSGKTVAMPAVPVEFSAYDTASRYEKTGAVGRDTDEVLSQIGYTGAQVGEMRKQGIVK
ncbi:MAG: CoA transferase [Lachnospiraceae bacterium]|jgi:crotonobetainyl-CoA:carnitine CoA-transferase CaiB-like acyl-CoA transferase|nr:CoA transferase [Lachnospiraceae bacterium]